MPNFKKIDAAMVETLRSEGATTPGTAKPTQAQIDEFMGRFKIASVNVEGATYGFTDNPAWLVLCPNALALIVGRKVTLSPDRQLELALAGNSDPRKVGDVLARYALPSGDMGKVRVLWLEMGDVLGMV